jgi:pyruvate,water dikinase
MRDNNLLIAAEKTLEIKGQIASPGLAVGLVKICRLSTEINKIKKGDILVTAMTTPDFVPAMRKAAAVVTDEGGITSHAAIVARELKKPCIIGAKIATQVLRDGDLVEVNANAGIIKILEK